MLLRDLGYEVHVAANFGQEDPISVEKRQKFISFLKENDVTFYHLPFPRGRGKLRTNFLIIRKLNKLVKKEKYNMIHTNSPLASALIRVVARKNSVPVLYTVHGFQFFSGSNLKDWLIYYPIERFLAHWTTALITINQEDYQRAKKMHYRKVYLIPGVGVDVNKEKPVAVKCDLDPLLDNRTVLTSVGELNENKNHLLVLKAIAACKNKEKLVYLICGIGDRQEEYQEFIRINHLEKNVYLLGYRTDVAEILSKTDVFVFPSFREGLSVAVMEAMAAGKPVFASEIRGNVDLVKEGKGGCLFDPNDLASLVQLLDQLPFAAAKTTSMQEYNRKKIQGFSNEIVDHKMIQIYRELLE